MLLATVPSSTERRTKETKEETTTARITERTKDGTKEEIREETRKETKKDQTEMTTEETKGEMIEATEDQEGTVTVMIEQHPQNNKKYYLIHSYLHKAPL